MKKEIDAISLEIKKYMSNMGRKGGKTKGKSKVRGDSEYYRRIAKNRHIK